MKPIPTAIALLLAAASFPALAHDDKHFSAGEPGNPKLHARIVTVTMRDDEGKMRFEPARLTIRKGEQVRFIISNVGTLKHEFTLASVADNNKHAEIMKKYPDMEHDDPNAKSVDPGKSAEIVWRFTKPGDFEFACLIPGHREAGMHGMIHVKR